MPPPPPVRGELIAEIAEQCERSPHVKPAGPIALEELCALNQTVALILRGYLALPPRDRIAFISAGVFRRPISPT